jgi:hypothetical protein
VAWKDDPREGKITLHAAIDRLLSLDTDTLAAFNRVDAVVCTTWQSHTHVQAVIWWQRHGPLRWS